MKLFHHILLVFVGLVFSHALHAQVSTNEAPAPVDNTVTQQAAPSVLEQPASSNETVSATAEAAVNGESATASSGSTGTPFDKSPYPVILEKMPFGTPPDLAALNAAATSKDEAIAQRERETLASTFSWTAINITPDGKTAIGFTDLSAKPPANYYMAVGESANSWKVVEADYISETATIEKDGVRISLKFGNKSPIAPTTPGASPTTPSPLGTPALTTMAGHNHGQPSGDVQPIVETHTLTFPGSGGRPTTLTSASHSSLLTSYRDRLNERLKAQENQKLETDRKQKEEISKLVNVSISDALRKQQEEAAAAAQQQQLQGETPAPQIQQIEIQVQ